MHSAGSGSKSTQGAISSTWQPGELCRPATRSARARTFRSPSFVLSLPLSVLCCALLSSRRHTQGHPIGAGAPDASPSSRELSLRPLYLTVVVTGALFFRCMRSSSTSAMGSAPERAARERARALAAAGDHRTPVPFGEDGTSSLHLRPKYEKWSPNAAARGPASPWRSRSRPSLTRSPPTRSPSRPCALRARAFSAQGGMWEEIEIMRKLRRQIYMAVMAMHIKGPETGDGRHPNVCRLFETFESESQAAEDTELTLSASISMLLVDYVATTLLYGLVTWGPGVVHAGFTRSTELTTHISCFRLRFRMRARDSAAVALSAKRHCTRRRDLGSSGPTTGFSVKCQKNRFIIFSSDDV